MKIAVVTGVSKGLGESIAKLFLQSGVQVVGVSRSNNEGLRQLADEKDASFNHYSCDLRKVQAIEETFLQIYTERIVHTKSTTIYIVNNEGVVATITQTMH